MKTFKILYVSKVINIWLYINTDPEEARSSTLVVPIVVASVAGSLAIVDVLGRSLRLSNEPRQELFINTWG